MYRSRDEGYMTRLRHQLMINEGTPWLVDRRWAYRYFQKYLLLDDLHTWAAQAVPGATIPLGVGPLEPQVAVVTPAPVTRDERKAILGILQESGVQKGHIYWTSRSRLPAGTADASVEEILLASELKIVNAPLVLSFGVVVPDAELVPFATAPWKDGTLLQLPPLDECESCRAEVVAALRYQLSALTIT